MKPHHFLSAVLVFCVLAPSLSAQPPFGGRGGFGDRDDDDDRERFRGRGGFGGRGGFPGRGDDDGRRGARGRGGFGGRGDDGDNEGRDRFRRRGGFSGRGGRGGRGGFDPSEILRRLDRNDNGVLDPDEQDGPAGFIIRRLQRDNPDIEAGKPIPLDRVSESFERMRRGRNDDDDSGRDDEDSSKPELLVPGFGIGQTPMPLLGFGPAAEWLSVPVTEEDEREAAERMRRYDRDRDGFLTEEELRRSRFSGNPLDFDRNRDGRLAADELAIRYARRRQSEQAERAARRDGDNERRGRGDREEEAETRDPYGGRNSYRALAAAPGRPAGLPGWFTDRDRDGDDQVAMAEYTSQWNDALVEEFFRFDLNRDGWITAGECLEGIEQGASVSAAAMNASSEGSHGGSIAPETESANAETVSSAGGSAQRIDAETMQWAKDMVGRYDANGDGVLTPSEWQTMLVPPSGADADQDGRITVEEYAAFRQQ